jgi:PIN domain
MSVYKRGGIYWYEFEFAGSRIRESAKTNSKRIAQEAERKRRRDPELGINRIAKPAEMPLLKFAAEKLIEDKRVRRSRNTGELYRYALKPVVKEFSGRLVCDISPEDIAAYQPKRLSDGMSARTVNIEVGALRAVLKAHRLWGPISDGIPIVGGAAIATLDRIEKLLAASASLEPSDSVKLRAAQRAIEKKAPFHRDKNAMADAIVVETYAECARNKTTSGIRFAFVTHNKNDFGAVGGNQKLPHPDLANIFSRVKSVYFINLAEALRRVEPSLVSDVMLEQSWTQDPVA